MRGYSKKSLGKLKGKEIDSGTYKILDFPSQGDRDEFVNALPRKIRITFVKETGVLIMLPKKERR